MRSASAREIALRGAQRLDDRNSGLPRTLFHTVASRIAAMRIADSSALPVAESNVRLADASGNAYFLLGYSSLDGPDILA